MEQFYTIEEVSEALKVTRAAIYKWMKEGKLGYVSVGSDRRIPQSALDAFLGLHPHKGGGTNTSRDQAPRNEGRTEYPPA